jgi:putative ABC transport system permease protein
MDEIQLIRQQEGDWHGKITGTVSEEDVAIMERHPNVKKVILEEPETDLNPTAYLYLYHPRKVYQDLPELVEHLGLNKSTTEIEYHDKLLSKYFIFSEGHNPPLIMLVYIFILLIAIIALILIIHNAFGISMMARLHQLGILQSIGATPRQLCTALIHEAVTLCLIPSFVGVLAGAGLCYVFMRYVENVVHSVRDYELIFRYHPFLLLFSLAASLFTVWFSARIPARKLSRLSPLEAIRYEGGQSINRIKRFSLISRLLGTEGELARKSLYIRRKAFRTASVSLTLSFLIFSAFLNLETISGISTGHTFFERYKDTWDLMVSFENSEGIQEKLVSDIRNIQGVKSCISYQKVTTYIEITTNMLSDELACLRGIDYLKDNGIVNVGDRYRVNAPLLVLDDNSFRDYCLNIDVPPSLFHESEGPNVILINTIWDNINSNRRYKKMIPFIKIHKNQILELTGNETKEGKASEAFSVKIAAASEKLPNLREEFDDFSLIQIMPVSTYSTLGKNTSGDELYVTILADSENEIGNIQKAILKRIGNEVDFTVENRIDTEKRNSDFRKAYKIIIGSLAGLLVFIGLANVLSNTLGLIYQRKREISRYITIGLSPKGVVRILIYEATILAVKPILISLLINIPLVLLALNASLIRLDEFMNHIPVIPIVIFAGVIIVSVEAAYYIAGRRIYSINLVDTIKNDTMM